MEASLQEAAGSAAASSSDETARLHQLLSEAAELRKEVVALRTAAAREAEHHRGVLAENSHVLAAARLEAERLEQQLQQARSKIVVLETTLRSERESTARTTFDIAQGDNAALVAAQTAARADRELLAVERAQHEADLKVSFRKPFLSLKRIIMRLAVE